MFKIEEAFSKGVAGDTKMVIDRERGAWMQRVRGLGREPGELFKLVWKDHIVPFEATWDSGGMDPTTGKPILMWTLRTFGRSYYARDINFGGNTAPDIPPPNLLMMRKR